MIRVGKGTFPDFLHAPHTVLCTRARGHTHTFRLDARTHLSPRATSAPHTCTLKALRPSLHPVGRASFRGDAFFFRVFFVAPLCPVNCKRTGKGTRFCAAHHSSQTRGGRATDTRRVCRSSTRPVRTCAGTTTTSRTPPASRAAPTRRSGPVLHQLQTRPRPRGMPTLASILYNTDTCNCTVSCRVLE